MTFTFEETTVTRKWLWVALTLTLLITFLLLAQNVRANGLDFEMIVIRAEQQQVDVDGDGRLESLSADYTVYDDGTAEGVVYIDNERFDMDSGEFGLTAEGEIYVRAADHEVGHWLGLYHTFERPDDDCELCYMNLIWDIDSAAQSNSVVVFTGIIMQ